MSDQRRRNGGQPDGGPPDDGITKDIARKAPPKPTVRMGGAAVGPGVPPPTVRMGPQVPKTGDLPADPRTAGTRPMGAEGAPGGPGGAGAGAVSQPIQPARLPAGTMLLDRYRVLEKIDVGGGQADLYLCEDTSDPGTRVVVKIYWGEMRPDRNILEDLKGIRHEDIISFLDCGTVNERFFEVMEYAAGGSLEERARERPFEEEDLTSIVIPE
ncbi:MAG: hypothetical protein PHQ19_10460, partial [Candidatus Krumholzibacteria bacterium]|nr:hypothetical protein [Candidatus Krumholzibacteria bacterium]